MKLLSINILVFYFIIIYSLHIHAQTNDIVEISGYYEVEFPDNKSLNEVKKYAQEQATINALEKEFGVIIIEGNSTYAKNIIDGTKNETNSVFNSIGNHWVKGEVIEVTNSIFDEIKKTIIVSENEEYKIKHKVVQYH